MMGTSLGRFVRLLDGREHHAEAVCEARRQADAYFERFVGDAPRTGNHVDGVVGVLLLKCYKSIVSLLVDKVS